MLLFVEMYIGRLTKPYHDNVQSNELQYHVWKCIHHRSLTILGGEKTMRAIIVKGRISYLTFLYSPFYDLCALRRNGYVCIVGKKPNNAR